MTVRTFGPTQLAVAPATAADIKVTYTNGVVPTFTTPVTVDPTTKAVSFALDDGGYPPINLIVRVQQANGGSSTTLRVSLPVVPTVDIGAAARAAAFAMIFRKV